MSEEKKQYGLNDEDYYDYNEIKQRIENRNKEKLARKKRARNKGIIFVVLFVLVVGLGIFSFSNFFKVDHIAVEGNSHYSDEEIINMSHATPGKNLLYNTGAAEIKEYLDKNPYIKSVKVTRRLPSTLVINVEERKELGAIIYDDDFLVIDTEGILLKKTQTEPKLTLIKGLVIEAISLGEAVKTEDEELLEQTLNILNSANKKDLYFTTLDMSEMYIRANIYDSLICKGTYRQLMDAIEKDRLHKVLEKLFSQGIKRGTITFSNEGYASFEPSV